MNQRNVNPRDVDTRHVDPRGESQAESQGSVRVRPPIRPFWARGTLVSVNLGRERHQPKIPVPKLTLVPGRGAEGDAHAGPNRVHAVRTPIRPNTRQVSLIDRGVLRRFEELGFDVGPGVLGENLTVEGVPLDAMQPGDRLYIGDVVLEVMEQRQPCTSLPTVDPPLLEQMVGRSGLLARIVRGGVVRAGMPVAAERAEMPEDQREELGGRVVEAALEAFGDALKGAVLKGSAYKGGYIPGWSDFDVHLLVDGARMQDSLTPRFEDAVKLQQGVSDIDPKAYRVSQLQVFAVNISRFPEDWVPPVAGTFKLLWGDYPGAWNDPDPKFLRSQAHRFVASIERTQAAEIRSFMDKAGGHLPRRVRLLGASVKPMTYCAAILRGYDPIRAWTARVYDILEWGRRKALRLEALWEFYTGISEWEIVRDDPAELRRLWIAGMRALDDIKTWCDPTAG